MTSNTQETPTHLSIKDKIVKKIHKLSLTSEGTAHETAHDQALTTDAESGANDIIARKNPVITTHGEITLEKDISVSPSMTRAAQHAAINGAFDREIGPTKSRSGDGTGCLPPREADFSC